VASIAAAVIVAGLLWWFWPDVREFMRLQRGSDSATQAVATNSPHSIATTDDDSSRIASSSSPPPRRNETSPALEGQPQQTTADLQPTVNESRSGDNRGLANGQFAVHVASFRTQDRADILVASFRKRGFSAFTAATEVSGEPWLRVYVGPYPDENAAEAAVASLGSRGLVTYTHLVKLNGS
jgi:cell division septation protein DedD